MLIRFSNYKTFNLLMLPIFVLFSSHASAAGDNLDLSDKPIPMLTEEEMPRRVAPLLELGGDFLGPGNISAGWEMPGGSVWIPQLWVYGNIRTAFNAIAPGSGQHDTTEMVVQPTINFNLKLTATERFFLQIRPLDTPKGSTRYSFSGDSKKIQTQLNASIRSLFFEGDLGEMFPVLDPEDSDALDIGLAVGRQQVFYQEGMLINDSMDAVGIIRDTVIFKNAIDTKFSMLYAWNQVGRADNSNDDNSRLYGLFIESDNALSTIALDLAYIDADDDDGGDGLYFGVSSVQRVAGFNTAVRYMQSLAQDGESNQVADGSLFFGELSFEPNISHNIMYANAFAGLDDFSSASRGPQSGGPLGRVGILFAAPGTGPTAPLGSAVAQSFGGAVGYQMFFSDESQQLTVEVAAIESAASSNRVQDGVGAGLRFQQKFLDRYLFQIDGFYTQRELIKNTVGGRVELVVQF